MTRWIPLAVSLGVLALVSCSRTPLKTCDVTTCPTGCCDAVGSCHAGASNLACGKGGALCATCNAPYVCQSGLCLTGDGGGSAGGGSVAGGGTFGGGGAAGGGGATGGGSAISNVDQFLTAWIDAACNRALACGNIISQSQAACHTYYAALTEMVAGAAHSGQLAFNSAMAPACLAQISSVTCENVPFVTVDTVGPACSATLTGAVDAGSSCSLALSCANSEPCQGQACQASCIGTGGLNQPCKSALNCNPGLWCDFTGSSQRCKLPGTVGAACNHFDDRSCVEGLKCLANSHCAALPTFGDDCDQFGVCDAANFCSSTSLRCEQRKAEGMACMTPWECQSTLTCTNNVCLPRFPSGHACRVDTDCVEPMGCDAVLQTCQALRQVDAGEPCTSGQINCPDALYPLVICRGSAVNPDGGVGTMGLCRAPRAGDLCRDDSQCPPAFQCTGSSSVDGLCVAAGAGTRCTFDSACRPGDFCLNNTSCTTRIASGAPCPHGASDVCAKPGDFCFGLPAAPSDVRCRQKGATGAACQDDSQCAFGFSCANSVCGASGTTGTGCIGEWVCVTGVCDVFSGVTPHRCGGTLPDTRPCNFDRECTSGFCDGVNKTCASVCH